MTETARPLSTEHTKIGEIGYECTLCKCGCYAPQRKPEDAPHAK